ncbi:MAG: cupin domain-containing protein [Candidatus Eisenbacteria bacterium]|nr:cupin domain-containing protein [Candidatus Eisenbacteria bacterium]
MGRIGNRTSPGRFTVGSWKDLEASEAQRYLEQQVAQLGRITAVRCVYREGADYPEHFHPQEQVTIVEEGALEFHIGEDRMTVSRGEMISVEPGVRHATRVTEGSGRVVALNLFLGRNGERHGRLSGKIGVATFLT